MSDRERSELTDAKTRASSAGIVLVTLAAGQFLMTLDSSVMNVSIATVAKDVGTDVTGIQTAITLYTLVMASLMITGGKVGAILGRRRAFAIGCVIYGAGSFTTSIAPNLAVLILGWSFLEGAGAALIMPAIVALKAGAPVWLGLSPVVWLVLAGGLVLYGFFAWENYVLARGRAPLLDPKMLENLELRGGLIAFFFQFLLQAGLFYAVPLFLSV